MNADSDPSWLPLIAIHMEGKLRAQLIRITNDPHVAQDLLQDVHLQLLLATVPNEDDRNGRRRGRRRYL